MIRMADGLVKVLEWDLGLKSFDDFLDDFLIPFMVK